MQNRADIGVSGVVLLLLLDKDPDFLPRLSARGGGWREVRGWEVGVWGLVPSRWFVPPVHTRGPAPMSFTVWMRGGRSRPFIRRDSWSLHPS